MVNSEPVELPLHAPQVLKPNAGAIPNGRVEPCSFVDRASSAAVPLDCFSAYDCARSSPMQKTLSSSSL
jgi:hypothetical protein